MAVVYGLLPLGALIAVGLIWTWTTVAAVVGVIVACVPQVIAHMKGHRRIRTLHYLLPSVGGLTGALQLAKPNSSWAQEYYSPAKLEEARRRYPELAEVPADPWELEDWQRGR